MKRRTPVIAEDFLLGGRTSLPPSARTLRQGRQSVGQTAQFCLGSICWKKDRRLQPEATQGYGGAMAGNVPLRCRRSGPIDWLTKAQQSVWILVPTSSFSCALNPGLRIPSISAMDKPAQNDEGSTDIYFGPKSPSPHARAAQK